MKENLRGRGIPIFTNLTEVQLNSGYKIKFGRIFEVKDKRPGVNKPPKVYRNTLNTKRSYGKTGATRSEL